MQKSNEKFKFCNRFQILNHPTASKSERISMPTQRMIHAPLAFFTLSRNTNLDTKTIRHTRLITVKTLADTDTVEKLTLPTSPTNNLNGTSKYLSGSTIAPKPVIVARKVSTSAST